jgi:hypothetical protein
MENYKNESGRSSVLQYEIGNDFIIVEFKTPSKSGKTTYKYTYESAGKDSVEEMKKLAIIGGGLRTYILAKVHDSYESCL